MMPEISIYANREDAKSIEESERALYVRGILEEIGIPLDEVWPDEQLTVDQKIELRKALGKYSIQIIDNGDRQTEIFVNDDLIAKWFKPRYIMRVDPTKREKSKQLYYEMILKTESLFDLPPETEKE